MAKHATGRACRIVAVLCLLSGAAGSNYAMNMSRLVMGAMPLIGRNHFSAVFTVVSSAALGASPILFGALLDAIAYRTGGQNQGIWNRYAIFFALVALGMTATLLYSRRVTEPRLDPVGSPT